MGKRAKRPGLINSAFPDEPKNAAYFNALGRFVDKFAVVESFMAYSLWHYANTKKEIARAVFSGVKVNEAMSLMKRLMDARNIDSAKREDLEFAFQQLSIITGARNDLLHFGAVDVPSGAILVTNVLRAHLPERVTAFPVSKEILDNMTVDLEKILIHLRQHHMGLRPIKRKAVQEILQLPWLYKHEVQHPLKKTVSAKSQPTRKRAPKQPPPL